jgi:hypothetical protein
VINQISLALWSGNAIIPGTLVTPNWDGWYKVMTATPALNIPLTVGDKLQLRFIQPASSDLPPNTQFYINATAHCENKTS